MAVGTSVRIYDLARELKQDTKRVIEELRREGADVSVPSNSVSREIAEKVRNRYFPKSETSPRRVVKVIKKEATAKPESTIEEMPTPETAPQETRTERISQVRRPEARQSVAADAAPRTTGQIKELK
ncbi:MAG: translation initiation factor IF-2 N-terminal domain-containing protein [Pyrinomonadaceae bacterium]|nr:translation initiation factor IF-2 N-terminal domain-containing protein [Pyrinomonadaceae bacterium]